MLFYSLDIETTGLDFENDQILEIAIIEVDSFDFSEKRSLCLRIVHDRIRGQMPALIMNQELIKKIYMRTPEEGVKYVKPGEVSEEIMNFFPDSLLDTHTFAGKNIASFDIPFLRAKGYLDDMLKIHRRYLDPSILYWDPNTDDSLPNLELCKKRAGYKHNVNHTAIEDARDVVNLIRSYFLFYRSQRELSLV